MGQSHVPAPDLVNGLRRLVLDINAARTIGSASGLQDVLCGTTDLISFRDDSLQFVRQPVADLVAGCSFERVVWLLLHGELPLDEQCGDVNAILADAAVADPAIHDILGRLPLGSRPLELFPLCLSLLSCFDPVPLDNTLQASRSQVWRLLAQLPPLIASGLNGGVAREGVSSPELTWGGRLLHLLRGTPDSPTPAEDRAMNVLLTCECMTTLRPACFAARTAASAVNHLPTALQNAANLFVAQLRNDPFQWTADVLRGLSGPKSAEAWWIRREGAPMPFGFGPQTTDPRPSLLAAVCRDLLGSYERIVLEASARRLERVLEGEHLYPTTDWMAARVMTLLDIPADRQSLLIAFARLAGWSAQCIEQSAAGVSLLPELQYAGRENGAGARARAGSH